MRKEQDLNRKHFILFWLIVGLPLVLIIGLGWRLARDEQQRAQAHLRSSLRGELQEVSLAIRTFFEEYERRLLNLTDSVVVDTALIRDLIRRHPYVEQMFVVGRDGLLIHPDPQDPRNASEQGFLDDFGTVLTSVDLLQQTDLTAQKNETRTARNAWLTRFHGAGVQLIYSNRLADGQLVGVLTPRARWMSDLIGELPEDEVTVGDNDANAGWDARIRMVDSSGETVYEWGGYDPVDGAQPIEDLAPESPLSSWRLQCFVDTGSFAAVGRDAYINLVSTIGAAGLALLVAGAWFFREYNRNVRLATQRVSFVNQVSHELKTPLTNIRMYAELLENDLEVIRGEPGNLQNTAGRHLNVIVEESRRLSRLIGNVLTFAKEQRGQVTITRRSAVIDDVIDTVLQNFEPALQRCGLTVSVALATPETVRVDVDALEQMLGNLLSNVEKYAASGKNLFVESNHENGLTKIVIRDDGPGIPARQVDRVFRPFHRLSNHISDTPGTGIGLSIARRLARLHGGDLVIVPTEKGACFELRIRTPSEQDESTT